MFKRKRLDLHSKLERLYELEKKEQKNNPEYKELANHKWVKSKKGDQLLLFSICGDKHISIDAYVEDQLNIAMELFATKTEDGIFIGDIQCRNLDKINKIINRGIGSELLKYLEEIKPVDIKKVYGNLSKTDIQHSQRAKTFYENNGFTILLKETEYDYGTVTKTFK